MRAIFDMSIMMKPLNMIKAALFIAVMCITVSLSCSNAMAAASKKKPPVSAKTVKNLPEEAVNNYIKGYLSKNWNLMISSDANMQETINNKANRAPQSLRSEEARKGFNETMEYFNINEQDKMTNGTLLKNVIGMLGGSGSIPFFKVLYPNMSYKILEVRNKTVRGPFDEMGNFTKEAFVELSYGDPGNAPRDNNQKVKKAVVIAQLQPWSFEGVITEYKVLGYAATDYGIEYFVDNVEINNNNSQTANQNDTNNQQAVDKNQQVVNNQQAVNNNEVINLDDAVGFIKGLFK